MLNTVRLAGRLFWRDIRSGQWLILFFALFLSVTVIASLDFYTNRVQLAINQQANRLLGGDLAVVSASPISSEWEEKATALALHAAQIWTYPTVAKVKGRFQLVMVQAVSDNYPVLDGNAAKPAAHTIWLEPRLLTLLSMNTKDEVTIGSASFSISRLIAADNDLLSTGWVIAPRVMMRLQDVPATKTVIAGSRVEYRLLLAGEKNQIDQFRRWLAPKLTSSQRVITVRDQQSFLKNILTQVESYLQLVVLLCLTMSGVAIALGVTNYIRQHYQAVALWRCLGMRRHQLIMIIISQLAMIALAASVLGVVVAYVVQWYLSGLLADFLPLSLPSASWITVLKGVVASLFLLFAFSYRLINELPTTSPLYLWRGITASASMSTREIIYFMAITFLLLWWIMDIGLQTLLFIDVIIGSIAALYAINIFYAKLTRRLLVCASGPIRRGLASIVQHPETTNLQFSGMTLIFVCLFMLSFSQGTLIAGWQKSLPSSTPNYFIFNIAAEDIPHLKNDFNEYSIPIAATYPMVRGRLVGLNNQPIMTAIPAYAQNHNTLHRELNLSWMLIYPSDNQLVAGHHWQESDAGKSYASVESSMASALNLHLGDVLTFRVGEKNVNATIVNFRTVDWGSFHPNFYVIFSPGVLDGFPATYIASFYLPENKKSFLNVITQNYPSITLIDVADSLRQLQAIITKVTLAIQYLFSFVVMAGVLIIFASIQLTMSERNKTWQLLRVLGASRKYIAASVGVEFIYLLCLMVMSAYGLSWGIVQIYLRLH